jgi:glycosidase
VGDSIGYRRLALLEALMLTLPGVPCIYQGDEFGQPGANDPDNRRMMQFGDELTSREKEQYATVKALVHLRRTSMPLIYGTYIPLYADKDVMAYARTYGGETVVVALNKSDAARRIEVTLPSSLAAGPLRITIEPVSFEIEKVNQSYNIP